MTTPAIVTLLTDFGTADGYVAEVKGVVLTHAPGVTVVDAGHEVPPGDVGRAARALGRYWDRFPAGTVHLCVVDPGVGTARKSVAIEAGRRWYVGPDNGLVTRVLEVHPVGRVVALLPDRGTGEPVSRTFHGRDVFAPAAAHLATGGDPAALGEALGAEGVVRLPLARPRQEGSHLVGAIVGVDRFGNLTTNLRPAQVAEATGWEPGLPTLLADVGGHAIPFAATYGEVDSGTPLLLIDSEGWLEIAVRDGSAERALGAGEGDPVRVRRVTS